MTPPARTFIYGKHEIEYRLFYVDRKTLEISVHPDTSVIVKAPLDSDLSKIEEKLKKRARWILKQGRYFEQFYPRTTERQYLSGETHLYLGKRYQLRVMLDSTQAVRLKNGAFIVQSKERSQKQVEKLMQKWYREKAKEQFYSSLTRCWKNELAVEYDKPRLQIKRMEKRWGSLSPGGILTLNIALIKAPKECIDYVVTHELCHLKHPSHGKEFYQLLEAVFPNWKMVKHKLEMVMS